MKTILLTGSNGLLGQKLVHQLKNNTKFNLIATSKGENRISDEKGYTYLSLDITNAEQISEIFDEFQPDIVVNTAAMTNVDACENNKKQCWDLNVNAVSYLITESEKINAHLIHLSTDFIFDGENGPYTEDDDPNPLSYYGESKYQAELLIKNSKLKKWAIARTIIVYGIVEDMSRSNVVLWAKSALEKGDPINVVDDQFRAPTLAEDLARGCVLIAEKEAFGVYNVSGKNIMSILELVNQVADFYQLDKSKISPIKSETLNQAAKRPPVTGFDLSKSKLILGYTPLSFKEGLQELDKQLQNR